MSKQANTTLIGGFVVGAIAIVVLGILFFGSNTLMTKKEQYVLFFDSSVKGLNIGSSVQLIGMTIGQVKDMKLLADPETLKFYNQVIIEVLPDRIYTMGQQKIYRQLTAEEGYTLVESLIRKGLRAKLEMVSFVTGQLQISFDFYPGSDIYKVGLNTEYYELPTIPSEIETFIKKLEKIPVSEIVDDIHITAESIKQLVRSPEVKNMLANLDQTLRHIDSIAGRLDSHVDPLMLEFRKAVADAGKLLGNLNTTVPPISEEIITTLKSASTALDKTRDASAAIYQLLEEDSEFSYNLQKTMQELQAAGRSIRTLADYLERHPEALLRGKTGGD